MKIRIWIALLLGAVPAWAQVDAPSDTTSFLERLQREDDAWFDDEELTVDPAYRDSLIARLRAEGVDALLDESGRRERRFRMESGPDFGLLTYNRVEGLVGGGYAEVQPFGRRGPALRGTVGWAFGSEALRHRSTLRVPLGVDGLTARAEYGDRVVPFGANRPTFNAMRALVSGADEQDYLRRRGGAAGIDFRHGGFAVSAGYEAARESSVPTTVEFALAGDLPPANPAIDSGIDRAAVLSLGYEGATWSPWRAALAHRIAGGALSGDFTYTRTDLGVGVRRFVGRFEIRTQATGVHTTGSAPVQRAADVGGIDGVRGYPRRSHVGRSSVSFRTEIAIGHDLMARSGLPLLRHTGLQFVPFADAARVFEGDSDTWIHSAGLGVQRYLGGFGRGANLRLDVAVPIGPRRPDEVVFLLRFASN